MSRGKSSAYGSGISVALRDSVGIGKDNFPTSVLTPPPKYPPLSGRPAPLVLSTDQEYMLAIGKELFRSLRGFNYKDILTEHLPSELTRTAGSKRSSQKNKESSKRALMSLDALEALEKTGEEEDEGGKARKKVKDEDEEEAEEREGAGDELGSDIDEELDEGTDYANNYFDNGEDYGDNEDDNLDEGGIY